MSSGGRMPGGRRTRIACPEQLDLQFRIVELFTRYLPKRSKDGQGGTQSRARCQRLARRSKKPIRAMRYRVSGCLYQMQ